MSEKSCTRCRELKCLGDFSKDKRNKDGLCIYCRACNSAIVKAFNAKKVYGPEGKRTREFSDRESNNRSKRMYGVSRDEIVRIGQRDGCAVCGVKDLPRDKWHLDHDHTCCSGQKTCGDCIRGVLCNKCNIGLGYFGDSPLLLEQAARYLASYNACNNS